MLRTILVVIHAAAGIIGLAVGLAAFMLAKRPSGKRSLLGAYVACLAVLLASLIMLIVVDWPGLQTGARVAFVGLAGLGVAMLARVLLAWREAGGRAPGWRDRYVGHIYFTYVSLWIGFVVLPALNLPFPQVSVPLSAVVVLVIGTILLARYRKGLPAS
jgi:hypothetical protein